MKLKKRNFLALLLCAAVAFPATAQERAVTARIVDAETNEPLPYAKIYVSPEKGTMTNDEGDFLLTAAPEDTLRITFIGYEGQNLAAEGLPPVIRMRRIAFKMKEVTVLGSRDLMERIEKRLRRIYKKNRKRKSSYFMRQTNVLGSEPQMVEAYIEAKSAVNLREISFLSGRHFKEEKKEEEKRVEHDFEGFDEAEEAEMMQFSNAHLLLSLGPLVMDEPTWTERIITPFNVLPWGMPRVNRELKFNERGYEMYYDIRFGELTEPDGRKILRVEMNGMTNGRIQLCGVLYVDAKTLNPLSFDGYIKGHQVRTYVKTQPARTEVHIRYDDNRKRPLISQITATIKTAGLECRTLLFRTDWKTQILFFHKTTPKSNMLEAIRQVGYDPELWKDPIVKRTLEEERLMMGK